MLRWIIGSSLKFRFLVVAAAAAMLMFGYGQLRNSAVDVFPEFAPPMVEIQTPSLGLSAAEVESMVTIPLEEGLRGTPLLDVMRSKSVPDLSSIKLYFKRGTDLMTARQMVQERVAQVGATLPTWSAPPVMLPPLSATSRCMKIGVSSKTRSVIDLSMIGYWTIRQKLLDVKGVANIAMWGERIEMLQVQVIPGKLKEYGLSLDTILKSLNDALEVGLYVSSEGHHIGTGGWIETPNQRLGIRHVLPIVYETDKVDPNRLAEVVVTVKDGKPILMKDVARVVIDHQPMIGDAIINEGPGLLLIVEKFPWANGLQVTKGVEAAINVLRPGLPDVDIDTTIFRPATYIQTSIDRLSMSMIIGCVLLVCVLFFFLYEWRVALISCTAMPLSIVGAGLVLYYRGATINTMILAGLVIALGDIVDDAIIDVENVVRRLREYFRAGGSKSLKAIAKIILNASIEVRGAIVYATLIEVMAIMPVFFMEGLSGAFFKPLAMSYALALLVSMVIALTVTPAMCLIMLRNAPLEGRESPIVRLLQQNYTKMLAPIIRSPKPAYATVLVIIVAGAIIWPRLGQSLLPDFKERDFLMHWLTKPGTSWPEMNRITIQASKELRAIPGVRNFGAHIGQALIMDEVYGVYFGENWISVEPSVDYDQTLATIQSTVDGYPGLYRDVQTYLKERIREVLTGTSEAIVIRIYGQEFDALRDKATEVRQALEGIQGIADLKLSFVERIPQVEVKVDLEKARQFGVKPGDVRRNAGRFLAGEEAGDIHRGNRTWDVNVWSIPEARDSLTDIRELPIDTADGGTVPLDQVADVRIASVPNHFERENMMRKIDVKANVKDRDLGSVYADVRAALANINFPQESYPELLGEYTERQAARGRLQMWALIAMVVVFGLLQASFRNWKLALIAFLCLPSALVGGVLAAWMGDGIISLGSLVGFLTVLGIAARNSIMLIEHFQHLEDNEGEAFGPQLVLRGAKERISPIMMTALTTFVALVPLIVAGSIPGHEIEHPMAIVILGGLVTSTLLNLFVVPSLYLRFGGSRKPAGDTAGSEPQPALAQA
jgi:CzcA family heavy metal efflux pump